MLQHEVMVADERHNNGPQDLVSDISLNMLHVEVMGWCGYTRSVVVKPVGCTAEFSAKTFGREMHVQSTGNSSGKHACDQHANCRATTNCEVAWIVSLLTQI